MYYNTQITYVLHFNRTKALCQEKQLAFPAKSSYNIYYTNYKIL